MRSRSIKPGFFKNCELADAGPHAQLLFAGLWCLADKEGRLKDQPRVIKAEIFPYYECDVNGELTVLSRLGLIRRYVTSGMAVVEVLNFKKHQSPHHTERASELPPFDDASICSEKETDIHGDVTVNLPLENGGNPSDSLFSDSGLMTHDLGDAPPAPPVSRGAISDEQFLEFKLAYPQREGDYRWKQARGAINARIREGHTLEEIMAGVRRYAEHCTRVGKVGTEYVKQASSFIGTKEDKPFLLPWRSQPQSNAERVMLPDALDVARRARGGG